MFIEQADFNTVMITLITSTSALVAILGGFFISRIISLASEHNSIYIRYKKIESEIQTIALNTENIRSFLELKSAQDYISENIISLKAKTKEVNEAQS